MINNKLCIRGCVIEDLNDNLSNRDYAKFDEKYVKTLHDNNYWFAVWTVDHLGQGRRFIDMGVDTITSNRAALLKTNTFTVEKIK